MAITFFTQALPRTCFKSEKRRRFNGWKPVLKQVLRIPWDRWTQAMERLALAAPGPED
jgi:hypothetical protein